MCLLYLYHALSYISVNTISLAKPEKAKMVEGTLIQMAQSGQIQNKVQIK
jgi:DNA-binding TFAR19-related protein (PDSD5 family)